MFLAYTDVSGRPEPSEKEDMVLASVIISESEYQHVDDAVKRIKQRHFLNLSNDRAEIHVKDMINRRGIFKAMSWDEIYAVLGDMFGLLAKPEIKLTVIATLVRKEMLYPGADPELWAYRLLFERLDAFINKRNSQLLKAVFITNTAL